MKTIATLSMKASLCYLDAILGFVSSICRQSGMATHETMEVQLAVEESVALVIEHSYEGLEDEDITLSIAREADQMIIAIRDHGLPYVPDETVDIAAEKTQGLGLRLIGKAVDGMEWNNHGRGGKELILRKRLLTKRIDTVAPLPEKPTEALSKKAYTIREPKPEEAINISRLAWYSYGLSYYDYIYYPETVAHKLQSRELISRIAALDDTGEFIGHLGFKFEASATMPELGMAFVHPSYRRYGIFSHMHTGLIDYAYRQQLDGFFVRAVTVHVGSQKVASHYGLIPCGLTLGILGTDVSYRKLAETVQQRRSMLYCYHAINKVPVRLSVPQCHRRMVERIYGWWDIPASWMPELVPVKKVGAIDCVTLATEHNGVEITVTKIGEDTPSQIKILLQQCLFDHVDAVQLNIAITDEAASWLITAAEKMGFFFSGVLPRIQQGNDRCMMMYLNNIKLDYKQILLATDEAREILDYVTQCRDNVSSEV